MNPSTRSESALPNIRIIIRRNRFIEFSIAALSPRDVQSAPASSITISYLATIVTKPGVQLSPQRGLCGAKADSTGIVSAVSHYGLLLRMRNTPNREVNMHSAAMAMTMAPKSA